MVKEDGEIIMNPEEWKKLSRPILNYDSNTLARWMNKLERCQSVRTELPTGYKTLSAACINHMHTACFPPTRLLAFFLYWNLSPFRSFLFFPLFSISFCPSTFLVCFYLVSSSLPFLLSVSHSSIFPCFSCFHFSRPVQHDKYPQSTSHPWRSTNRDV